MKAIWAMKLREIDELISNTEIGKDGRLMQLYKKRDRIQEAFNRC